MSQLVVDSINYTGFGNTGKFFNVELKNLEDNTITNYTLVGNVEESMNSMDKNSYSNRLSMKDVTNNVIIHSVFDINDTCIRSSVEKSSDNAKTSIDKYVEMYTPQFYSEPIQFHQIKDSVLMLTERSADAPIYKATSLINQDELSKKPEEVKTHEYLWEFVPKTTDTYTYNKSVAELSNMYNQYRDQKEIKYNYLVEFDINNKICNYFNNGDMIGNFSQLKNTYDSLYSMEKTIESDLKNSRQYCGISKCGNTVFLKYYDNIDYSGSFNKTEEDINVYKSTEQSYYSLPYQKIETLDSYNKFSVASKHKSNLYSINIKHSGLKITEDVKTDNKKYQLFTKIQNDIKNNIHDIVKHFAPVETQLFDVYFEGDI